MREYGKVKYEMKKIQSFSFVLQNSLYKKGKTIDLSEYSNQIIKHNTDTRFHTSGTYPNSTPSGVLVTRLLLRGCQGLLVNY